MKGFIFAAGIGSRLRPFTDTHPKALVEVGGKPMLLHVIDRMIATGITDITVNVHHFSSQIIDFLASLQRKANFHISDESRLLLDTGGGLLHARSFIDDNEPVLVHNADILSDIDFLRLLKWHESAEADVTLATQPARVSSRMLFCDTDSRLAGWKNMKSGETRPTIFDSAGCCPCAFAGVHIINPRRVIPVLERYSASRGPVFSVIPFYLENLCDLKITTSALSPDISWFDIGKPETLEAARHYLASR